MKTAHKIIFKNSKDMDEIPARSVNLVLTSPPYPMIEIWDSLFSSLNPMIGEALKDEDGMRAYNLMHKELDKVWDEIDRVVAPGAIICINIGDATRKIGDSFQVYPNHSHIIEYFKEKGYNILPLIIWRKETNKPTKFMGSGMLPPNAYVTHEHEYILIFRKDGPRQFKTEEEKKRRRESAYFWEERNEWFSDLWTDLTGVPQKLKYKGLRERAAAYPFELAYRLINMYSIQGDTILDPFLGTGTTMIAAMCAARNSIGYEIDNKLENIIKARIKKVKRLSRELIMERLQRHLIKGKNTGYKSKYYGFNVMTKQETNILFHMIKKIKKEDENEFKVTYKPF